MVIKCDPGGPQNRFVAMSNRFKTTSGGIDTFKGSLSTVQEFYLEFFGTLVPGVIAVTSAILLGLGFYYYISADSSFVQACCNIAFRSWGGGLLYLVISYVIGGIAYRRNPKTPDTISAHRQWKATMGGSSSEEVGRLSVSFDVEHAIPRNLIEWFLFRINREQWILRHAGHNIDYPYPHMRQYLCCRGFWHLAEYVPWCEGSGGRAFREPFSKGKCTKHYVNIIKQRLRNSGRVNLLQDMMRNECNIRMLSSLWYILVFVRRMLECSIVVAVLAIPFIRNTCSDNGCTSKCSSCQQTSAYGISCAANTNNCGNIALIWNIGMESLATLTSNVPCKVVCKAGGELLAKSPKAHNDEYISKTPLERFKCLAGKYVKWSDVGRLKWFFFIVSVALVLTIYCQRSIEFGFHYVRTREVTMILESAWLLDNVDSMGDSMRSKVGVGKSLFDDLRTMGNDFKQTKCSVCKYMKQCYPKEDETYG